MKKGVWGLILGIMIGAALTAAVPAYGAGKQYVLTLFERPLVVNGVKYADQANPILNYNGKTYIPLAKIGALTGVEYQWNSSKKQVEIGSDVEHDQSSSEDFTLKDHYSDDIDAEYTLAKMLGDPLPPLFSEGWLTEREFYRVYSLMCYVDDSGQSLLITTPNMINPTELLRLKLPAGWKEKDSGETTINNIKIIKFNGINYLNISDLQAAGVIK